LTLQSLQERESKKKFIVLHKQVTINKRICREGVVCAEDFGINLKLLSLKWFEWSKTGDLFGHFSFFTSQPRETDCECASATHLISCSQKDFLAVAKDFPKDYVICIYWLAFEHKSNCILFSTKKGEILLSEGLNHALLECQRHEMLGLWKIWTFRHRLSIHSSNKLQSKVVEFIFKWFSIAYFAIIQSLVIGKHNYS